MDAPLRRRARYPLRVPAGRARDRCRRSDGEQDLFRDTRCELGAERACDHGAKVFARERAHRVAALRQSSEPGEDQGVVDQRLSDGGGDDGVQRLAHGASEREAWKDVSKRGNDKTEKRNRHEDGSSSSAQEPVLGTIDFVESPRQQP